MTVNSSSTRELTIDKIVRLAIQKAGLMPAGGAQAGIQWNNYASQARDFLDVELDGLSAEGSLDQTFELYPLTLVASTASYALPSTTVGVVGDAMYLSPGSTQGATPVKPMDRAHYQSITDKVSEGTPTLYWCEAHSTVTLYLWPVPSEAGTLTLQRNRLLADNTDGSKTVDLARYWTKFLVSAVAHEIGMANGVPETRLGYIRGERERALIRAKSFGMPTTPSQVVVTHTTGWSR